MQWIPIYLKHHHVCPALHVRSSAIGLPDNVHSAHIFVYQHALGSKAVHDDALSAHVTHGLADFSTCDSCSARPARTQQERDSYNCATTDV